MLFRFVSVSVYAVGDELEYNPSLRAAGVSPEAFADFPAEKKAMYANLEILETVTTTKYYKVVSASDEEVCTYSDISAKAEGENIFIEVSENEYKNAKSIMMSEENAGGVSPNLVNPDTASGTWYEIETKVSKASSGQYLLEMYVEIIGDKLDEGLRSDHKGYIAGGVNTDCSPISGSEYLHRTLMPILGSNPDSDSYYDAPYKGNGYGFDYSIGVMAKSCTLEMGFLFEPRKTITMIDAYGYCGYWDQTITGSISIDISGPSISVSPTTKLVKAPDTHAQIRP